MVDWLADCWLNEWVVSTVVILSKSSPNFSKKTDPSMSWSFSHQAEIINVRIDDWLLQKSVNFFNNQRNENINWVIFCFDKNPRQFVNSSLKIINRICCCKKGSFSTRHKTSCDYLSYRKTFIQFGIQRSWTYASERRRFKTVFITTRRRMKTVDIFQLLGGFLKILFEGEKNMRIKMYVFIAFAVIGSRTIYAHIVCNAYDEAAGKKTAQQTRTKKNSNLK